jgi:hypothetical protein
VDCKVRYVPVSLGVGLGRPGLLEPGMLVGGVVDHKVKYQTHTAAQYLSVAVESTSCPFSVSNGSCTHRE